MFQFFIIFRKSYISKTSKGAFVERVKQPILMDSSFQLDAVNFGASTIFQGMMLGAVNHYTFTIFPSKTVKKKSHFFSCLQQVIK